MIVPLIGCDLPPLMRYRPSLVFFIIMSFSISTIISSVVTARSPSPSFDFISIFAVVRSNVVSESKRTPVFSFSITSVLVMDTVISDPEVE